MALTEHELEVFKDIVLAIKANTLARKKGQLELRAAGKNVSDAIDRNTDKLNEIGDAILETRK